MLLIIEAMSAVCNVYLVETDWVGGREESYVFLCRYFELLLFEEHASSQPRVSE